MLLSELTGTELKVLYIADHYVNVIRRSANNLIDIKYIIDHSGLSKSAVYLALRTLSDKGIMHNAWDWNGGYRLCDYKLIKSIRDISIE